MVRRWIWDIIILSLFIGPPLGSSVLLTSLQIPRAVEPVREGWAVILEMNEYPGSTSDLPTDYSDTKKWNATLQALGWQAHHIHIVNDELPRSRVEAALQFLLLNADVDDVVLLYVFSHGSWIATEIEWQNWLPDTWALIPSQHKLLVISACAAESFIDPLRDEPSHHVHIASVRENESSWAGLPQEGLPIIGDVFNHYFTAAFLNSSADTNEDGDITVEEAFAFAYPLSQHYISNVVFPAYPYYANICNGSAPIPVIDDSYPGDLSLQVEQGDFPIDPFPIFPYTALLIFSLIGSVSIVIITSIVLIWKHRTRKVKIK